MYFNSIDFGVFLPVSFGIYWFLTNRSLQIQNLFLVVASYFFYGCWDWRFLGLLFISSLVDFLVGLGLDKQTDNKKRKVLLAISLSVNLGLLIFFKYFNFFIESFQTAFSLFGREFAGHTLSIILPVGISFYSFQTLSYAVDVYRRRIPATHDPVSFFAYVSFFPQLVAGPIERANHFLPQFQKKRIFNYPMAVAGMRQILWGLIKKIIIADNCAQYVDSIFAQSGQMNGSTLFIAAVFFSFQIYGDFSGYTDIAIGTGKLFGFSLMRNFAYPYFSRDTAEFWRRWHISLSTWFRDYLYFPLGGSRGSLTKTLRNTLIIFIVSGLWHGANWTFVFWGLLNALYYIPYLILGRNRKHLDIVAQGSLFPSLSELMQMIFSFLLVTIAWIFFRSDNIEQGFQILSTIFSSSLFSHPTIPYALRAYIQMILLCVFIIIEWRGRHYDFALAGINLPKSKALRWSLYFLLIASLFLLGNFRENIEFIYFQF